VVDQVLAELEVKEKPVLHVFNKIDALDDEALASLQERVTNLLPNSIFVSAIGDGGLEPLRRSLLTKMRELRPVVEVRLPGSAGKLLAEIHRTGEVVDQRTDGAEVVLRARLDEALVGRLRRDGAVA